MKKLFLLFIALISSTLNNAMSTNVCVSNIKDVKLKKGTITQMFLFAHADCVAYEFVEQKTNKATRIAYCRVSQIYQGIIRHDKSQSKTMDDQAEMKAAFEKFEAKFNANSNKAQFRLDS